MKRYSQMSPEELKKTITELNVQLAEAEKNKLESNAAILKQKINLAKSYQIEPDTISIGKTYRVQGYKHLFQVEYLNGIYAWGTFDGRSEKEAFPLSLLINTNKIKPNHS